MRIYPAIDIKDGRCVRLIQGDYARQVDYNDDPVAVARDWQAAGSEWIHTVDLDGARSGVPKNRPVILRMRQETTARIQVGGGIRSLESVSELLDNGIDRIVLGTAALNDPVLVIQSLRRWPGRIAIGLDTRNGLVTTDGWLTSSNLTPREVMLRLAELGAGTFIYTDISRDGMLGGPNLEALQELVAEVHAADAELIASGGVASLDDLAQLTRLGVDGVIIGRALYTGDVDLGQALSLARRGAQE